MSASGRAAGVVSAAGSGSSHASTYEATRRALEQRKIDAVFTERSHRFEERPGPSSSTWVEILSEWFKIPIQHRSDNAAVARLVEIVRPAIEVLDALHEDEEAFSLKLFESVVRCFDDESGGWVVRRSPARRRRVTQRARDTNDGKGQKNILEFVFDGMIVVGRRVDCGGKKLPSTEGGTSRQERALFPDNTYVCYVGDVKYAMGLSRKVKMIGDETVPSIIEGDSFPDLAWVVFKKNVQLSDTGLDTDPNHEGSGWSVHHLVAAIELKMESSSKKIFNLTPSTKRLKDGSLKTTEGADESDVDKFGPVLQEVAYIIGHVLPGRASIGLDLSATVPFAVVAGRSTNAESDKLHWVHGNVITPDECGGDVYFVVDAFDQFRQGNGSHALAAFLDVLVDGLGAAEEWLVKQAAHASDGLLPPKPLTGRTVKFGGRTLENVSLMYSPLTNRGLDRSERAIKVVQGEIFGGEVDLSFLRSRIPNSSDVSWCRDTFGKKTNQQVLVKVVSCACYGQLVGQKGVLWKHRNNFRLFPRLRECLAPSLHAVYITEGMSGQVQIMPNLSTGAAAERFTHLYPILCTSRAKRHAMWTAFEGLVRKTLIPLAEADVIHPDIRPGYDETANLMWNEHTKSMLIIDLDSLVMFGEWASKTDDKRYISRRALNERPMLRNAFDFLFCQVIVITDSWIGKIRESEANASAILAVNEMILSWSSKVPRPECDASNILDALEGIGERFTASEHSEA